MAEYQIQEYTKTSAAIAILRDKHSGPFDVTTTKGMSVAKEARAEIRGYRVALEKLRVELKAPALERTRLIDAEAKRITAELLAIEEPIDQQIKAEEKRKEEEKAAKARAEAARLASINAKISVIRNQVAAVANQTSTIIKEELDKMMALELTEAEFQEFIPDAQRALTETQTALQAALQARIEYETEQVRIKAEQEAEQARIQAEREELEQLRQLEVARLQAERERQEAELKEQREEQARKDEEIRQQQAIEAARLKAEQKEIEQQRAELEAQQRKIEEQAKVKSIQPTMKGFDPIADIKQALNANAETAKALDEAYRRGYEAGFNTTQS